MLILGLLLLAFGSLIAYFQIPWYYAVPLGVLLAFAIIILVAAVISKKTTRDFFFEKSSASKNKQITQILNARTPQDKAEFCAVFPHDSTRRIATSFRRSLARLFNVPSEQIRNDEIIATFQIKKSKHLPNVFYMAFFLHLYATSFVDPHGHDLRPLGLTLRSPWWNEKIAEILKSSSADLACFIKFAADVNDQVSLVMKELEGDV